MTVDDTYQLMNYICNVQQSGDLTPVEFNRVIRAGAAQFVSHLLGDVESYLPGRPTPRINYGMTENARQRLAPLIYGPMAVSGGAGGFYPYPSDYQALDTLWTPSGQRVRFCPQNRFWAIYGSVIDPYPTNPFYLVERTGLRFYPANLQAQMYYVQDTPPITWAYTIDPTSGLPVYDVDNSVDPPFYDADMMEIIARALRLVGVNLSSAAVQGLATEIKAQGQ